MEDIIIRMISVILPLMAVIILIRIVRSMFIEKAEPEVWGYIQTDSKVIKILHWENLIGRTRSADIKLNDPKISRVHAVLIRSARGTWRIFDIFSKGGIRINGEPVGSAGSPVRDGDVLNFSEISVRFRAVNEALPEKSGERIRQSWKIVHPAITLLVLTIFQVLLLAEHSLTADKGNISSIALGFVMLILIEWFCYFAMRSIRRTGFEVETVAFFLSSIGLSVVITSTPDEIFRQLIIIAAGVICFFALGWWLRDLERTKKFRIPVAVAAVGLLFLVLLIGQTQNGAKNWIYIGSTSIQPSEFVKVAYIYVGAATLERLFSTKNLIVFIAFSAICVIALALMGDFGTALIFFVTFLVISFMRSGSVATVALAVTGAGMAGFLMLKIKAHIAQRFAVWGHVWEHVYDSGYQQTRALSAGASGGLLGKGAGNGWLKNGFAANTDTVFSLVCEELGLIIAICAVLAILTLAFFAVRSSGRGRSAYYSIAACSTASLLIVQLALNVFGSVDILPFTGVTFPFVSKGGTSVLACWMLLAFIKAGDTRKGASFVVKPSEEETERGSV